jgi:hypothetical protein
MSSANISWVARLFFDALFCGMCVGKTVFGFVWDWVSAVAYHKSAPEAQQT